MGHTVFGLSMIPGVQVLGPWSTKGDMGLEWQQSDGGDICQYDGAPHRLSDAAVTEAIMKRYC